MLRTDVKTELDRQTDTLVALGYADLAGVSEHALRTAATSLADPLAAAVPGEPSTAPERASFVLVVNPAAVPASARVPLLDLAGRAGTLSRHFADIDTFRDVVEVPEALVYAVVGVERGDEFCGVRPSEAAPAIEARGRSMLTIVEGLAFLHASPQALERNRCFHTGATRDGGARVPAVWIADRAPHLGWCWWNNHHTWLGVASAETRITGDAPPVVAARN
jgi:hypothetical protein